MSENLPAPYGAVARSEAPIAVLRRPTELLASSTEFLPVRTGWVYALVDADYVNQVRYIGSTLEPRGRLWNHLSAPHGGKLVQRWIASVINRGGSICMTGIASSTSRDELYEIEGEQLRAYRAIGMADLNGAFTRPEYSR